MKNVAKKSCPLKMKTSRSVSGSYSLSAIFVGAVLFMFAGNCMASPVGSVGVGNVNHVPSLREMKSWVYSYAVQLSRIVGETQVDFAQKRLGDRDYDGYVHSIPGLPRAIWNQDKIQEKTLLKMQVENLYTFIEFFNEIKTHEKKGSAFVGNFQQIVDELHFVIGYFQQVEMHQGYPITHPVTSPQPTRKPATTQKEQDEWTLGVMKELLYWLIPVQVELHRQITNAK